MAISPTSKGKYYPAHPPDRAVDPVALNEHLRATYDNIYDLQFAVAQMSGGATAFATIVSGGIGSLTVMYPGFGYSSPPTVTITGGGGSGAVFTATVSKGRVTGFVQVHAGTGYTTAPTVTITP